MNPITTTNTLVFASSNANKIAEIKSLLPSNFQLLSSHDLGINEEIPETADTLEGNALMKAQYLFDKTSKACFADDTGLEVMALNGRPGVFSARYAGPERSAQMNIEKLLHELDGVLDRRAQFRTAIAFVTEKGDAHVFEGKVEGLISTKWLGNAGFGYDPVFLPEGLSQSFAEMTLADKNARSHRARAFEAFIRFLETQKN